MRRYNKKYIKDHLVYQQQQAMAILSVSFREDNSHSIDIDAAVRKGLSEEIEKTKATKRRNA